MIVRRNSDWESRLLGAGQLNRPCVYKQWVRKLGGIQDIEFCPWGRVPADYWLPPTSYGESLEAWTPRTWDSQTSGRWAASGQSGWWSWWRHRPRWGTARARGVLVLPSWHLTCNSLMATQELDGNPWSMGTKNCRHPDQWPMRSIMQIKLKMRMNTPRELMNWKEVTTLCQTDWLTGNPERDWLVKSMQERNSASLSYFSLVGGRYVASTCGESRLPWHYS